MINLSSGKLSIVIIISLILLNQCKKSQKNKDSDQRPNFVVVMTDDQGYGDAGYLGNKDIKTPNLDDLAQSGLRLDRFYAFPVCSPTRASVLTGRNPMRTGVFSWGHALRPQEQTIANILNNNGYQTGFFGKWHLGSVRPNQLTSPSARGFDSWYAAANFYDNDPWFSKNGIPVQLQGESSVVTVREALKFIEETQKNDAPFLVFIWLGSPHLPHEAKEGLKDLYPNQPENMKNYYGEISGIDRAVGKLRNRLKKLNISEQTLLWFLSDNGGRLPEASNGVLRDQKASLYEGGIRVPALIEWPGRIESKTSNVPAGTIDIFPTLKELAGLDSTKPANTIDGVSLVPLLKGEMKHREKPFGFWSYPEISGNGMKSDQIIQNYQKYLNGQISEKSLNEGRINWPNQDYPGVDRYPYSGIFAWIDGDWKLYQDSTNIELYNLENDPKEAKNLVDQYPKRVEQMKKNLRKWLRSVKESMKGDDY